MRILSIDVGRKNLAACAYDGDDDKILAWTVRSMNATDVLTVKTALDTLCQSESMFPTDIVLIERQPEQNPTMRRLEGVIAMYFTMRGAPRDHHLLCRKTQARAKDQVLAGGR